MGFGAKIKSNEPLKRTEILTDISVGRPQKYGMIPEFLDASPVVTSLDESTEESLIKILLSLKCTYQAVSEAV